MVELTPDLKAVFDCWVTLVPARKSRSSGDESDEMEKGIITNGTQALTEKWVPAFLDL